MTQQRSSTEKVRAYRQRMRRRGYRPVQIWLPDVRTPEFAELAHRISLAIAASANEQDDQAFVESLIDWDEE